VRTTRLFVVGFLAVVATACATNSERTRDRAVEQARSGAHAAVDQLEDVFSVDHAPTGDRLLAAAQEAVPDRGDGAIIYRSEQVDDDTVRLGVAFDGYVQSGGGDGYFAFRARVCLELTVTSGDGVEVEDADCRQEELDAVGLVEQALEVVPYED
jgi:hypothetical protein